MDAKPAGNGLRNRSNPTAIDAIPAAMTQTTNFHDKPAFTLSRFSTNCNGFRITAQHLVAPDAGELAPNPLLLVGIILANNFAPGGPPQGPVSMSVSHGSAVDVLQLSYIPITISSSRLVINTIHEVAPARVPEPPTVYLLCVLAFIFVLVRRATAYS